MLRKKKLSGPAALVAFLAIASAGPSFAQEAAKPDTPGTAVGPGAPTRGAEALRLFGKLEDDRSLVYIASGPPDARTQVSCSDLFRPIEVWTYLEHPKLGKNAHVIFYPESGTTEYRYWTVLEGDAVLLAPSVATKKPLLEIDAEHSACKEAQLVVTAFKEIGKRQADNNKGLEERAAMAVPHVVPPKDAKDQPPPVIQVSAKPLTSKERKQLKEALPEKHRQFLDDVDPIITDLERDTFLRISSEYQREKFVDQFWRRRSVAPDGMRIAFRDIYELRIRQARERFANMRSDQARIWLVNGPPDGIKKVDCQDIYWPIQLWYYERLESIKASKVLLLFYQPWQVGDWKLWTPLDGAQAVVVGGMSGQMGAVAPRGGQVDPTRCTEWRDVQAALAMGQALMGMTAMKTVDEMTKGPKPDVEGVDQILLMTTDIAAGAATLPIQRTLRFPEMAANKMRMELAVMLERQSLTTKVIGDETFLDIDVVGEVVKGEKLVDNFRYRFDFPASSVNGPFVPLTIERDLYPGDYQLKVKVADANRNAASLISEKLKVPETPDASMTAEEKAAREAAKASITRLAEAKNDPKGAISIVPLAREIATGLIRFETRTTSPDISFTEFYLDDARVMTKRRPPFEGDLNLGELPRRHVVKVIGYSKDGKALAEDEVTLNEGREAFRVRIASPEKSVSVAGPTRVVADVAIPETKRLKQVEIFVNENRAAVLYQPPFQQVVEVPKTNELGFLRVVATLDDGTSTEDLRYINAPKYLSEVNVRAVELYTSVFQHGRPVTGLAKESFRVFEDGVPQSVEGFEAVTNLPLSLGIGVDTSGSMEESMVDAQKAASEFLKDVMTPRDRCFLVTFDNEPQLVSHFTTDRDKLAQALAGLRAQGSTALWDAIVYGLYQYQGVKGRKAYVILTDGEDRSSKFPFEAAVDYAKKSGVAIYFIGLHIAGPRVDVKYKINKIARETGGAVYYVDSAKNLGKIYAEINEELRSQYLLSYIPQNKTQNNQWRKIEVKMSPDNLQARTISGYYP
jgi:VWFA-related protein